MSRLIYFEIRKSYLCRNMVVFFAVLAFINIAYIFGEWRFGMKDQDAVVTPYNITANCYSYYCSMHNLYDGKITKEKVTALNKKYDALYNEIEDGTYSREYDAKRETGHVFGDYYYTEKYFYIPMKYSVMYSKNMESVLDEIGEKIEDYRQEGNQVNQQKYEYLYYAYSGRHIDSFYETSGWNYLYSYRFSDLLILILLLFGIIPMFCNEKMNGMYYVILSNPKGKQDYNICKFISILIYSFVISILFQGVNFLCITNLFHLQGGNRPLYCIQEYQYTNLNCNLITFYFFISGLKILGFMVVGGIMGGVSRIMKGIVSSYLCNLAFILIGLYCSGFVEAEEKGNQLLAIISPITILKGNQLYSKVLDYSIGNHYFIRGNICILIQVGILLVLLGISIGKTIRRSVGDKNGK